MRKATFRGSTRRAQMTVLPDHSSGTTHFLVYALPARYHPASAYRVAGDQLYYGTDAAAAWHAVRAAVPDARFPRAWLKYLTVG